MDVDDLESEVPNPFQEPVHGCAVHQLTGEDGLRVHVEVVNAAAKAGPIGPFSLTSTRFTAPVRPVRTMDALYPSQEATGFLIPTRVRSSTLRRAVSSPRWS